MDAESTPSDAVRPAEHLKTIQGLYTSILLLTPDTIPADLIAIDRGLTNSIKNGTFDMLEFTAACNTLGEKLKEEESSYHEAFMAGFKNWQDSHMGVQSASMYNESESIYKLGLLREKGKTIVQRNVVRALNNMSWVKNNLYHRGELYHVFGLSYYKDMNPATTQKNRWLRWMDTPIWENFPNRPLTALEEKGPDLVGNILKGVKDL